MSRFMSVSSKLRFMLASTGGISKSIVSFLLLLDGEPAMIRGI
jgi:hypothetical protein